MVVTWELEKARFEIARRGWLQRQLALWDTAAVGRQLGGSWEAAYLICVRVMVRGGLWSVVSDCGGAELPSGTRSSPGWKFQQGLERAPLTCVGGSVSA